jgi:hypothetical protein
VQTKVGSGFSDEQRDDFWARWNQKRNTLKGKIMQWQLDALTELFNAQNLTNAEILVSGLGHATFSTNILPTLHQRIRNILAG